VLSSSDVTGFRRLLEDELLPARFEEDDDLPTPGLAGFGLVGCSIVVKIGWHNHMKLLYSVPSK
jgi:hypothetical protein